MLTVEDGTIVANADSYASLVDLRKYALARGVVLSSVDAEVEAQAIKAVDYLESLRLSYKGTKVDPTTQCLQWPRKDVYIEGILLSDTTIPKDLVNAQCQLVVEQFNGVSILPTSNSAFITKEKVGTIETTYSEKVSTSSTPRMPSVDSWLEELIYPCLNNFITTVRV